MNLLKRGAANLILAADSNSQSTVGAEIAFTELRNGASVVALVDTPGDGNILLAECGLWLRARKRDADCIGQFRCLTGYREHHEPAKLAEAILKAATGSPLLVMCDLSRGLAAGPDHPWLTRALALLDHLPTGCTVLSVITTGPEAMPAPPSNTFPADCVHHVQSSGTGMRLTVTPIKPAASAIQLVGKIGEGGIVLIDEQETEHV